MVGFLPRFESSHNDSQKGRRTMAKKKAAKKKQTGGAAIKVVDEPFPDQPQEQAAERKVADESSPEQPQEQPAESKVGKGRKTCPRCGELVGTRTAECPKCHHSFPVKAAKTITKRRSPMPRAKKVEATSSHLEQQILDLQTTAQFITKVGGLEQARKMLGIIESLQQ
jgi:hypothetical protein